MGDRQVYAPYSALSKVPAAPLREQHSALAMQRVGFGYDVHRLVEGRELRLGGVVVPFARGLAGHSDADVLLHAITDALLGAAALGDIGTHFPPSDARWQGADSRLLLAEAMRVV